MNHLLEFKSLLNKVGQHVKPIIIDGKFHRFKVAGDKTDQSSGWYTLFELGDLLVGAYGNWRTGLSEVWCSKSVQTLSGVERKAYAESIAKAKQQSALQTTEKLLLEYELALKSLRKYSSKLKSTPELQKNKDFMVAVEAEASKVRDCYKTLQKSNLTSEEKEKFEQLTHQKL